MAEFRGAPSVLTGGDAVWIHIRCGAAHSIVERVIIHTERTPTRAQVALGLLLAQEPWTVPIPGPTKLHRLEEDHGAVDLILTTDDLLGIDEGASRLKLQGARLPAAMEQMTSR